jgi:hypothetical protein
MKKYLSAIGVAALLVSTISIADPPQGGPIAELEASVADLQQRLAVAEGTIEQLEQELDAVQANSVLNLDGKLSLEGTTALFSGVNVQVVNGLGQTTLANGLGNLMVGYNEEPGSQTERTGSHNLIVGDENNYTGVGGVVFGRGNTIGSFYATVTGGEGNVADFPGGGSPHVSGGLQNSATGRYASVSGGWENSANGLASSVSGGRQNSANAGGGSISGGFGNVATGFIFNTPSVTGGSENEAVGCSSVSGGSNNFARGEGADQDVGCSSVSGGFNNRATRINDTISGGRDNLAAGQFTSISGGAENIAGGEGTSQLQEASSILGGIQQTTTADFETIPALP